ncbi:unnamed protein product [Lactuca virosa]|uniref:Uncharacterized protein n=1 Tax=Lactuca virosa TaxID=75947 RepID=A0AAU9LGN0_9ASTR|nr:unnamed protein product [Lactuca virosa]CAH1412714.1 unnamed protein product [Lactuca virosa]
MNQSLSTIEMDVAEIKFIVTSAHIETEDEGNQSSSADDQQPPPVSKCALSSGGNSTSMLPPPSNPPPPSSPPLISIDDNQYLSLNLVPPSQTDDSKKGENLI